MPVKCGACGKFVSAVDTAKCTKCCATYHRGCVVLPAKGPLATVWHCPECRKSVRRDNRADTPVRGCVGEVQKESEELVTMPIATPPAVAVPAPTTSTDATRMARTSPPSTAASSITQSAAVPPSSAVMGVENVASRMLSELPQDVGSVLTLVVEELRTLRFEVLELRKDVAELKASNDSCHTRMDDIESRLVVLEKRQDDPSTQASEVECVVQQLRRDLNDRDQELMANDLVIANVPESQAENLNHLFQLIATKLGVAVEDRDIVSVERVGGRHIKATSPTASTEPRPRAIMVRLARRDQRDAVLNGARVRRGATTENLGLAGKPVRFFINERLTKLNQQLFRQTRAAAGAHGWRFVWTKRGRILARSKPGDTTHRIRSDEDIYKVIGPYTCTNK